MDSINNGWQKVPYIRYRGQWIYTLSKMRYSHFNTTYLIPHNAQPPALSYGRILTVLHISFSLNTLRAQIQSHMYVVGIAKYFNFNYSVNTCTLWRNLFFNTHFLIQIGHIPLAYLRKIKKGNCTPSRPTKSICIYFAVFL